MCSRIFFYSCDPLGMMNHISGDKAMDSNVLLITYSFILHFVAKLIPRHSIGHVIDLSYFLPRQNDLLFCMLNLSMEHTINMDCTLYLRCFIQHTI
jgi:hypothetical protein